MESIITLTFAERRDESTTGERPKRRGVAPHCTAHTQLLTRIMAFYKVLTKSLFAETNRTLDGITVSAGHTRGLRGRPPDPTFGDPPLLR